VYFNAIKRVSSELIPRGNGGASRPVVAAISPAPKQVASVYANAMMSSAFEQMMCKKAVALSLINSVLRATLEDSPTITDLEPIDPDVLMGSRERGALDFWGQTGDGHAVVVEVQVRWEADFSETDLFSRPVPFADADFAVGDVSERSAGIEGVYVIQFVDYDLPTDDSEMEARGHFRVRHEWPATRRDGIHIIEIELPRIKLDFPVDAAAGAEWGTGDWWYYLLKFSDRFDEGELARWGGLGVPEVVVSALQQLDRRSWPQEVETEYRLDVQAVILARQDVERSMHRGRQKGELQGLINGFLGTKQLDPADVDYIKEAFPKAVVYEAWNEDFLEDSRVTDESYADFVAALEKLGLLGP
jgi:hypothetical protein